MMVDSSLPCVVRQHLDGMIRQPLLVCEIIALQVLIPVASLSMCETLDMKRLLTTLWELVPRKMGIQPRHGTEMVLEFLLGGAVAKSSAGSFSVRNVVVTM